MNFVRAPILGLMFSAAGAVVMPCAAQIEVTPFVGAYPQTTMFTSSVPCPPFNFDQMYLFCGTSAFYQDNALVLGGRVTTWVGKRLALDLSVTHWGSNLGGGVSDITTGGFSVLYNLTSPDGAGFFVLGGLSFVALGGSAYSSLGYSTCEQVGPSLVTCNGWASSQTDWGPVVGVGARVPFSRAVGLRVEVEDHLYWLTDALGSASNSSIEHALVFSVGPSLTLGGRRPGQ